MTQKIGSADVTDFSSKNYESMAAYQDPTKFPSSYEIESVGDTGYASYQNTNWDNQMGAYFHVPEFGGMIDTKARYVVGKGYKTNNPAHDKILQKIRGNGLDTANTIFYNAVRVYTAGGDFFAEIIKTKRGELRNLKPLNPSTVKVHANNKGIITKYDVFAVTSGEVPGTEPASETFNPDEIFHLAYNRIAGQIHGQSVSDKLTESMTMRNEAMKDLRVVFHRYVKPLLISSVDTDDATQIAAFKAKIDSAMALGENLVVPKDTVDNIERVSIPQFSTLDPLPWIKFLQKQFLKAEGVPEIALGAGAESTESESKMLYLAWQQVVEFNQMFMEEQIKIQLGLDIEFEFPANIAEELNQDNNKDVEKKGKFDPKAKTGTQ